MLQKVKDISFKTLIAIIVIACIFVMLFTFYYCDTRSLTVWAMNIWDLISENRLMEFYEYSAENLREAFHDNCKGNFMMLFPLAIWNLPVWFMQHFGGMPYTLTTTLVIWSKLFFVFCTVITAVFGYKICSLMHVDKNKKWLAVCLILVSPEILVSTCYAGQDEIVYICLFMIAIYFYLRGKMIPFLICSILSITFSFIMIMPYLLLVLIKEKNVIKDIFYVGITIVPTVIFEYVYRDVEAYQNCKTDLALWIDEMFGLSTIETTYGSMSVMAVLLVLVYFFAYTSIHLTRNLAEDIPKVFFMLTIVMSAASFLLDNYFYRCFLYVPFLIIFLMISKQSLEMNMFLLVILTYVRMYLCLGVNNTQNMNMLYLLQSGTMMRWVNNYSNPWYLEVGLSMNEVLLDKFPVLASLTGLFSSIAFAAVLLLLFSNSPLCRKEYKININAKLLIFGYAMCMPLFMAAFYVMVF